MLCAVLLEKPDVMIEIHTAGRPVLCRVPVSQAAKNKRLISGMSPDDALSIGVYFGHQKERETIRFYSSLIEAAQSTKQPDDQEILA